MALFASIVFGAALLGIAALFGIKYWEERTRRMHFPALRIWSDELAIRLKRSLMESRTEAGKLVPLTARLFRWSVHELALAFAALARALERQAHRLADMVSHKHRFERREPRNEFLKQVGEYKNGSNGEEREFDTTR